MSNTCSYASRTQTSIVVHYLPGATCWQVDSQRWICSVATSFTRFDKNGFLFMGLHPLPVTVKCSSKEIVSKIINNNTLLGLQPECNVFIGSTRVQANKMIDVHKNVTYNSHPVIIPYSCCNNIPENIHLPVLKPLKRSKLDVEGLKIAQRKLNQYSDELNKLLNQSFVSKHLNWITPLTITLIVMGVILYIICKYRRRRRRTTFPWIGIGITACNHKFPPSSPSQLKNTFMKQWKKIIPKRRPSINLRKHIEEDEETSLNLNKQLAEKSCFQIPTFL
ncbi:hypothetical protein HUJ05_008708 [Dendroctonus ponderosae]|nr:hypothetical protein HUJ05_008708 [Dendroctonus ponderosae]